MCGLRMMVWLCLAAATACESGAADGRSGAAEEDTIPTGRYGLRFQVGEATAPGVLELVSLDGRPWGRLTIDMGEERTMAVRGAGRVDGGWRFVVSGPVNGLELRFGSEVSGELMLAGSPPIPVVGRRTGGVSPEALLAHARLDPIEGLSDPDRGESFTTTGLDGALYFARHGLDLSDPVLMFVSGGADASGGRRLFPSSAHRDRSPFISPDGSRLVFASDRPVPGDSGSGGRFRLWLARWGPGGWSDPAPVVIPDWSGEARQPAVTAGGTLYFSSSDGTGGSGGSDLYTAAPQAGGGYGSPGSVGAPVNGPGDEHGAYVSPDGRWMILASSGARPGALGGDDLYVARIEGDGWSEPRNLGMPVNSFANEYGPWISRDRRFLYFTSDRFGTADLFRIRTERIEALRAVLAAADDAP